MLRVGESQDIIYCLCLCRSRPRPPAGSIVRGHTCSKTRIPPGPHRPSWYPMGAHYPHYPPRMASLMGVSAHFGVHIRWVLLSTRSLDTHGRQEIDTLVEGSASRLGRWPRPSVASPRCPQLGCLSRVDVEARRKCVDLVRPGGRTGLESQGAPWWRLIGFRDGVLLEALGEPWRRGLPSPIRWLWSPTWVSFANDFLSV